MNFADLAKFYPIDATYLRSPPQNASTERNGNHRRIFVLAFCITIACFWSAPVQAQPPSSFNTQLRDIRLESAQQYRDLGYVLLTGGAVSFVGGAALAGIGFENHALLAVGLGTASWGLINGLISLAMLDLSGSRRERILESHEDVSTDPRALQIEEIRALDAQSTILALNTGLDVFYIGTAVLMFFLADQLTSPEEADLLRGYAVAQGIQGLFLLSFDIGAWTLRQARAERTALTP